MAHDVRFSVTERELSNYPIIINVKKDGKALGTLEVSKGGVTWFPRKKRKMPPLSWKQFAEIMEGASEV